MDANQADASSTSIGWTISMSATLITLPAARMAAADFRTYSRSSQEQDVGMLFGKEHVRRYQETNGAEGYVWPNGTPSCC